MKRQMIAYVTAGAIAVTGMTTTTAQAGNNDVFNFIAGFAALAIIASEVEKSNRRQVTRSTPTTKPVRRAHKPRRPGTHYTHHRPKPPQNCLRQRHTNHGWKKFYSHRCLERAGYHGKHRHW